MRKEKVNHICEGPGEMRRKKSKIKGREDLEFLYLEENPTLFIQIKHLKVDQRPLKCCEKDQGNQLNVLDV